MVLHIVKTLILFKNTFILFLTTLALGGCAQAFSSCGGGLLLVAVLGRLTAVLLLLGSMGSRARDQ